MGSALTLVVVMMAIFLPIIILVFINHYFSYKKSTNVQLSDLKKELDANSTAELKEEIAALKERIVVLESIVTDHRYDLDQKIGNL